MKISLDNFIRKSAPFLIILNSHAFSVPNKFTAKFENLVWILGHLFTYIYIYTSSQMQGFPIPLVISARDAWTRSCLVKFRAGWEREAEISYDRRHEGIPYDERRPGHVAVRRPRVPCPGLQVSHGARIGRMHLFFFFFFFFFRSTARFAEPVASARPKLSTTINLIGLATNTNGSLPLFCPAQGFPLPSYR